MDEPSKVETVDYLGELKDEFEEFGSGSYIQEFYRVAPKIMHFLYFPPR